MKFSLLVFLQFGLLAVNGIGYEVVQWKGLDFSFTCPFKVYDGDKVVVARTDITNFHIGGDTRAESPKTVYNTSGGGLSVGLIDSGRYTAFKDEKDYLIIYISKIKPRDSGTWTCEVRRPDGTRQYGVYETLSVLGAEVDTTFGLLRKDGSMENYTDNKEVDLTASDLYFLSYVVSVYDLMTVRPYVSIIACYEDGSIVNLTSKFFHSSSADFNILQNGLAYAETFETFRGKSPDFLPGAGALDTTKGRVALKASYKYKDTSKETVVSRTLNINILAAPVINPDGDSIIHDVIGGRAVVTCHVRTYPRITSASLSLTNQKTINFTNVHNNNENTKDNITLTVVKADGDKTSNWYNLTIRFKPDPGIYGTSNKLTVSNQHGSDDYDFFLNPVTGTSQRATASVALLLLPLLPLLLRFT